jgi:hypothetical protein
MLNKQSQIDNKWWSARSEWKLEVSHCKNEFLQNSHNDPDMVMGKTACMGVPRNADKKKLESLKEKTLERQRYKQKSNNKGRSYTNLQPHS